MDRLKAMAVLVRVADCGGLSRAAESLVISKASVTTSIRNLEAHLQTTLIHRDTRRLKLTAAGESFVAHAREVLAAVERAEASTREQRSQLSGRLFVETPISFGQAVLCPRLPEFGRRYPGLSLSLILTNQPHNLIEHAIDVAIRIDHVESDHLVARTLHTARHVLCCAPEMIRSLPAHPAHLRSEQCLGILGHDRRAPTVWELSRASESITLCPDAPLHLNNSTAALEVARQGAGIVRVLDIFAAPYLRNGALVQIYEDWTLNDQTFYVVTAKHAAQSSSVRALIDFLHETVSSGHRADLTRRVAVRA